MRTLPAVVRACRDWLWLVLLAVALQACTTVTLDCGEPGTTGGISERPHGWCPGPHPNANPGDQAVNGTCQSGKKCRAEASRCVGGGGTCKTYVSGSGLCSCQCTP